MKVIDATSAEDVERARTLFREYDGLVRARVRPSGLAWVNRLSGAAIAGFGVWALAGLAR